MRILEKNLRNRPFEDTWGNLLILEEISLTDPLRILEEISLPVPLGILEEISLTDPLRILEEISLQNPLRIFEGNLLNSPYADIEVSCIFITKISDIKKSNVKHFVPRGQVYTCLITG